MTSAAWDDVESGRMSVELCNDSRRAFEAVQRAADAAFDRGDMDQWRSLIYALSLVKVTYKSDCERVAELCAPWFEVQR